MSLHTRTSHAGLRTLLPALLLSLLAFASANAQTQTQTQPNTPSTNVGAPGSINPTTDPQAKPTPTPNLYEKVLVTKVYNLKSSDRQYAGLNDIIIIDVQNLEALWDRAKCKPPYNQPADCREREISLFINGRPIRGLKPESGAPILGSPPEEKFRLPCDPVESPACRNGSLRYHLQRFPDAENQEHWADLLGFSTDYSDLTLERPAEVSVGIEDTYPVRTDVKAASQCTAGGNTFCLIRVRPWRLLIWAVLALATLIFLFWLARRYDLLCDRRPVLWRQKRPWSLSAVQAAWWFVLVVFSFVFIWLVTGQQDLSSTGLILISIGLGTALGATVIDSNKSGADANSGGTQAALNALLSQKQKLEEELNALVNAGASQAEIAAKKAVYDQTVADIKTKFPTAIGPPREKFILDILSDANGVSFHRFQMFVWTVVLGIFFVMSVLGGLAMPDFSTTLLGLMGISAGTYLGFKIPETHGGGSGTMPSITPDSGPEDGGTSVTIANTGFGDVKSVTFDGTPATGVQFDQATSAITAVTPAHAPGKVGVVVTNQAGMPAALSYTYTPKGNSSNQAQANAEAAAAAEKAAAEKAAAEKAAADAAAAAATGPTITPESGPSEGVTPVTIANTGFGDVKSVTFDGTDATEVMFDNATSNINAITPPHPPGTAEVMVTDQAGTSVVLSYTYNDGSEDETIEEGG